MTQSSQNIEQKKFIMNIIQELIYEKLRNSLFVFCINLKTNAKCSSEDKDMEKVASYFSFKGVQSINVTQFNDENRQKQDEFEEFLLNKLERLEKNMNVMKDSSVKKKQYISLSKAEKSRQVNNFNSIMPISNGKKISTFLTKDGFTSQTSKNITEGSIQNINKSTNFIKKMITTVRLRHKITNKESEILFPQRQQVDCIFYTERYNKSAAKDKTMENSFCKEDQTDNQNQKKTFQRTKDQENTDWVIFPTTSNVDNNQEKVQSPIYNYKFLSPKHSPQPFKRRNRHARVHTDKNLDRYQQ